MALISLLYATTSQKVLPEGNANPDRRMFMDEVSEQLVWWDDTTATELFRIPTLAGAGWLLNGNSNGIEKYIGTNDAFDFPIYVNGVEVGRFTPTGITLFDGAVIQSPSTNVKTTYDDSTPSYNMSVLEAITTQSVDSMGSGLNTKFRFIAGAGDTAMGLSSEASLPIIQGLIGLLGGKYFVITEDRFQTRGVPAYDDNVAALAGGLTAGDMYQTTGAGAIATAGVLLIVQ